jgi:hypothetical protein
MAGVFARRAPQRTARNNTSPENFDRVLAGSTPSSTGGDARDPRRSYESVNA